MFVSAHYARKMWTNHERKAAQERALRERGEYILPIRIDGSSLPGLSETIGYVSIELGMDRIAHLLIEKLRAERQAQFDRPAPASAREASDVAKSMTRDLFTCST